MQGVMDETYCGPVCQHPSCWHSQRRCNRGLPRTYYPDPESDTDDEGLPTQKVVNLLEDYGEDSRDRFPTRWGGRAIHERASSIANLTRAQTRDSFPKVRAPNASPVSAARLLTPGQRSRGKMMKKVEVQEVFDLADLESNWRDTFQATKYYVWVPNRERTKSPKKIKSPKYRSVSEGPAVLNPKDVTEQMVPEELEVERINQMMQRSRRECKTPTGGQPYSYPLIQDRDYNGLYDLLDLPREVLADIMSHIGERELKSKHQFVEAVIRTLPKLEKNHTAISLASSNVLLQQPVQLLQGELRRMKTLEPFTAKQIYRLDDKVLARLSTANEPPGITRQNKELNVEAAHQEEPHPTPRSTAESSPAVLPSTAAQLNKMKPLPAITDSNAPPVAQQEEETDQEMMTPRDGDFGDDKKRKVPSVALGLPTIPSGLRYTKTFTYNQQDFDFTLCPIPSPLQGLDKPLEDEEYMTTPVPPSTARSTGVATTRTPREDTMVSNVEPKQVKENTQGSEMFESVFSPVWNVPLVTQMVVHMPKTPNATPVTRGSTIFTDQEATPDPLRRGEGSPSPYPTMGISPRQPNIVTQKSLALTPDVSGTLKPIAEVEPDASEELGTIRHQMPRRVPRNRSVHFAPTVLEAPHVIPPQPPSSPIEGDDNTALTPWQQSQLSANNPGYQAYGHQDPDSLVIIGKGTRGGQLSHMTHLSCALPEGGPLPPAGTPTLAGSTPGMSTAASDPWLQMEEAFNHAMTSPSKSLSGDTRSALSEREPNHEAGLNKTPEASGRGSHLSKSAASNSSRDSVLVATKRQLELLESPGPPPPSPEPRDADHTPSFSGPHTPSRPNPLAMLAEEESESDMTISAKPPSYLDSVSRIPSPRSLATEVRQQEVSVTREASLASRLTGPQRTLEVSETSQLTGPQRTGEWALREQEEREKDEEAKEATEKNDRNLEQFDADDETFKEELQREYEKLAKQLT